MKLITVFLLLHISTNAFGQPASRQHQKGAASGIPGIHISAVLENPKYCEGDAGAFSATYDLKLHVKNNGNSPLILAKELFPGTIYVARDTVALLSHKYEVVSKQDYFPTSDQELKSGTEFPQDKFVIIDQGKADDLIVPFALVVRKGNEPQPGTISSGSHAVSIEAGTWPFPDNQAPFRKKWASRGRLVTTPIVTPPVTVTLPPQPELQDCFAKSSGA
jgi:hypothetical protein